MQQILKLLLADIGGNVPAIRVCDAGGGGAAAALPIGNFVFVNPLGNDVTGAREDFHLPFATLSAAKNAAIAGDTVFVYGGTYNEGNALQKDGVKWHFIGKPILNLFAPVVWGDNGVTTNIEITGDAIINHAVIGEVIRVDVGTSTTVFADFHKITVLGGHAFFFRGGSGIINVATKLEVTLLNRCIGLGGDANYVFNIDDIFCNATVGGISNAVNFRNQAPAYNGRCVFNSRIIRSDRARGATISFQQQSITGLAIFNITDKIHYMQASNPVNSNSAIQMLSGSCIVNGDIDGGTGIAIEMLTNSFVKSIEHNGNASNDGTYWVVGHGDDAGFWASGRSTVKLNGVYKSAHEKVIKNGTGTPPTPQKLSINGEIISNYAGVGNNYGLFLEADAGATLLDSVKIVSDGNGVPFGIGAAGARDVKIIHNVSSNVNVDANITNAIAGTQYVFDVDVE